MYLHREIFSDYVSKIALNTNNKKDLINISKYIRDVLDKNKKKINGVPCFQEIDINNKILQVEGSLNNEGIGEVLYNTFSLGEKENSIINNFLLNKNVSSKEKNEIRNYCKTIEGFNNVQSFMLKNRQYIEEEIDYRLTYIYIINILIKNSIDVNQNIDEIFLNMKKMLYIVRDDFSKGESKENTNVSVVLYNLLLIINQNKFFIENKIPEDIINILKDIKLQENSNYKIKELRNIEDIINAILYLNGNLEKMNIEYIEYYFHNNKMDISEKTKEIFIKKINTNIKKSKVTKINYEKNIILNDIFKDGELDTKDLYLLNNYNFFQNINVQELLKNNDLYYSLNKNILCILHHYNENNKKNDKDEYLYEHFINFYNKYIKNDSKLIANGNEHLLLLLKNNFINLILNNITLVKKIFDNNKEIYKELFIIKKEVFNYEGPEGNGTHNLNDLKHRHFEFNFNILNDMDFEFKKNFLKNLMSFSSKNTPIFNNCYKYYINNLNKDFLEIINAKYYISPFYDIKNTEENMRKSVSFSLINLIKIQEYYTELIKNEKIKKSFNLNLLRTNDISLI